MDLLERSVIFQFIETRETLEAEIAYLAAKRATAEDVQKLEKNYQKYEASVFVE